MKMQGSFFHIGLRYFSYNTRKLRSLDAYIFSYYVSISIKTWKKEQSTIGKEKKEKSRWSREQMRKGNKERKVELTIGKGEKEKSRWSREQMRQIR